MLEVSKLTVDGEDYLKIKVVKFDTEIINLIMTIDGWFKANEPMCYGLPYSALGDFIRLTKDYMVVWKSDNDGMGTMVKGINTTDVPSDYIIDYKPKVDLREHQIKTFNLLLTRDYLLISDQEGVGNIAHLSQHHKETGK